MLGTQLSLQTLQRYPVLLVPSARGAPHPPPPDQTCIAWYPDDPFVIYHNDSLSPSRWPPPPVSSLPLTLEPVMQPLCLSSKDLTNL